MNTAEHKRLNENSKKEVPLEKWGPYLSERQWGTVREDYSEDGDAWNYFPHDHARSRVYRWGEDGLAGISDIYQNLCFSIALWNGKDPILKERLFGLSNPQGVHGEDVKELYYYLDNIPTHYYMRYLYKYSQSQYPYDDLIKKNSGLSKQDPEYEILDTGIFNDNKYFDVYIEYAKNNSEDIFIKIEIINRGNESASLTVLPTLLFYNRWQYAGEKNKPSISFISNRAVKAQHKLLGDYFLYFQEANEVLFTENETNFEKLFNRENKTEFVKDAFHEAIINGKNDEKLKQKKDGTKCSPVYNFEIKAKDSTAIYLRLTNTETAEPFPKKFEQVFEKRKKEADEFYDAVIPSNISEDQKNIQRQAFAGLLWNKQFYHYDLDRWLNTSDGITPVTDQRKNGRNCDWRYLKNQDVMSMPDKWEYPWYAAWDAAFHSISLALIDPDFAKHQLVLLMREWYMNPQGQLPAYEWNFSDVNPPVHAFAALQVYRTEKNLYGKNDIEFLKKIFQKLIINFTWWINRKDANGNSIFEGGFLGLDNIGLFNRSMVLEGNILLEQADGTSWMGMYALGMMDIALEIAMYDKSFEDAGTKFYEHFVIIGEALNEMGLWNEEDKFFYDVLSLNKSDAFPLKVRSAIGLIPLFAVTVIEKEQRDKLTDFTKRMQWFQNYRKENHNYLPSQDKSNDDCILLSMVSKERLTAILERVLDESEFLSNGGIRALSKYYQENPYSLDFEGSHYSIHYDPADSTSNMFGGNSNWRGPVWMPLNFLFIHAIKIFGYFYEDEYKVECPKGSGIYLTLTEVATEITSRLLNIFEKNEQNERLVNGPYNWFYQRDENRDLVLFHEYFHGDNLRGLGASHQTGWTALVVNLFYNMKNQSMI
ncbi:glucosidase [Ginsengibacter hankyongi]|uniref:Glucosidase n=1 Tax=Ginsengibacter hankyongi TaxID=2607284 RepID=A0A5J5IMD8_9BACT|nr:glucosidase [Ginsengibacter hankyongi]KAA9041678.1 glucosidase [Ginsengibacter hankyongi]